MDNKKEFPARKQVRLENFDYSAAGVYFITICTENRRQILSRIVGVDVLDDPKNELLPYGKIADKYIRQIGEFYNNIKVDNYVIMPNHIHIMLFVFDDEMAGDGSSRTSTPTKARQHSAVSRFVSTFKRFCNKEYGGNIWQRCFHDHVIRSQEDYEKHLNYIYENPMRWKFDQLYSEE